MASSASRLAELQQVSGEGLVQVLLPVRIVFLQDERFLDGRPECQDGLQHSKLTVSQEVRVLPPAGVHLHQAKLRQAAAREVRAGQSA